MGAGRAFARAEVGAAVDALQDGHPDACEIFEEVALAEEHVEFLILVVYDRLA